MWRRMETGDGSEWWLNVWFRCRPSAGLLRVDLFPDREGKEGELGKGEGI